MKAIKPYAKIYDEKDNLKKIEVIGRTCYKSEGKIKEGSAETFVTNLVKRGHEAVLEHASFIFEIEKHLKMYFENIILWLEHWTEFKSFLRFTSDGRYIVSGNVRAWREFVKYVLKVRGTLPEAFKDFIFENPVLFPEYQDEEMFALSDFGVMKKLSTSDLATIGEKVTHWDVTVKFVVDRGISHEIVRHRPASFAQESTRYCNYSKDDFEGEITCIIPYYLAEGTLGKVVWEKAMKDAERAYFDLLDFGLTAQEARGVLPHSLKTELFMTANLAEWKHFFHLRAANMTGKAHPQMLEVAVPLLKDMDAFVPETLKDVVNLI